MIVMFTLILYVTVVILSGLCLVITDNYFLQLLLQVMCQLCMPYFTCVCVILTRQ